MEGNITFLVSFPVIQNLQSNQEKPNWKTGYKITEQYSSKVSRSGKTERLSQAKESKKIWQLNAMRDPGLGSETEEEHEFKKLEKSKASL